MKNTGMKVVAGFLAALAVACGGGSKEEKKDAPAAAATAPVLVARPADDAMLASCVKMREQMQLCREQAIDMMIAERAAVNPEMAAMVADAAKKAELRTTGLAELDADGGGGDATLAARTDKCKEVTSRMPAQIPQAMLDAFNGLGSCWDKPCADRVNCIKPFVVQTLAPPPAAPAAAPAPAAQ